MFLIEMILITSHENFCEINKMIADIPAIMHIKCAAHTLQLGVEDGLKEQEFIQVQSYNY